ncbi:MAG: hypothetical protein HY520_00230 [Candidatus Aenigmarchaeota archaeon]|nr:hypothetical protein [Candidatus Aenigmarchaeota archaeon]
MKIFLILPPKKPPESVPITLLSRYRDGQVEIRPLHGSITWGQLSDLQQFTSENLPDTARQYCRIPAILLHEVWVLVLSLSWCAKGSLPYLTWRELELKSEIIPLYSNWVLHGPVSVDGNPARFSLLCPDTGTVIVFYQRGDSACLDPAKVDGLHLLEES